MNQRNAKAWLVMSAAFPNWNLSAEQMALWDMILSESHSPEALVAGAVRFAQTSVFPPTLAAWSNAAITADALTNPPLTAAEAWDEMYRNRHTRYTRDVTWSSEAVLRAARAVRWDDPSWLVDQMTTIRAQFERYYNSLANKTERIDGGLVARRIAEQISVHTAQLYGPGYVDDAE